MRTAAGTAVQAHIDAVGRVVGLHGDRLGVPALARVAVPDTDGHAGTRAAVSTLCLDVIHAGREAVNPVATVGVRDNLDATRSVLVAHAQWQGQDPRTGDRPTFLVADAAGDCAQAGLSVT